MPRRSSGRSAPRAACTSTITPSMSINDKKSELINGGTKLEAESPATSAIATSAISEILIALNPKPVQHKSVSSSRVNTLSAAIIVDFLKRKGFCESRIRTFTSPDDCDEALSKGSENGGISAFFDVIPYSKLFLSKHCDKYVTAGPTYRTDGFAFVFPKGSPLVADVSRAVIELTENGKIL